MKETAYAKLNLALHVRRRRHDGYHDLDTLFAFVDFGDELTVDRAQQDGLQLAGAFADDLTDPFGNLVSKALATFPRADGLSITLEKNLPIASGLGGGSADAAAMIRILRNRYALPDDWQERAASIGADVPVCIESRACIGRGTGTELEPIANELAGMPVVLVNPGVPISTAEVFAAWDGEDGGPLRGETVSEIAYHNRNDLERIVIERLGVAEVADVLTELRKASPVLARMSGSGATCFALFDDTVAAQRAARAIAEERPGWWVKTGALRE